MKNNELIKSVKNVFNMGNITKFVIPNYQRGYKWTRQDVIKLLDDLYSFQKSHSLLGDDSFYCLQNITLVPSTQDNSLHVVDGQQRLTTLYILLSYIKTIHTDCRCLDFFNDAECLKYNVREETARFLNTEIFTGNIWKSTIEPQKQPRKDQYYIADVAEGIRFWFEIHGENALFVNTITDRLKLIVNNMNNSEVSEEEIFAGLNGGKVDLDGADLVRAELITRSAKEKFTNEKDPKSPKIREFRQRIAIELDEMSLWWSGKEQIRYFEQFLPNDFSKKNIFNHSTHKIGLLYKLYYEIYKKDNESFGIEFFENGRDSNNISGDDHWEFYSSLLDLNNILQLWFNDSMLYHWIGYLIFGYKQTVSFCDIWKMWQIAATKEEFLRLIIQKIQEKLKPTGKEETISQLISDILDTNVPWYGEKENEITRILVLMDVLKCTGIYVDCWSDEKRKELEKKNKNPKSLYSYRCAQRLSASYFQKFSEDYEHVRSCAPNDNEGKENRDKKIWLNHIQEMYKDIKKEADEWKMKEAILKLLNNYNKDILDDHIISMINTEMNKYGQHSIGNLVLLDSGVNRSYKNADFQTKIQRIFYEFIQGNIYIRPYTMIVFEHKIADSDKSWRWTKNNIKENAINIAYNVEHFFNIVK